MTKEQFMDAVRKKNPMLNNDTVTMRSASFMKALELAWDKAVERTEQDMYESATLNQSNVIDELMKGFIK